ncbi:hypothetical protein GF325_17860, partial [Candidatus Bathyarchaeota archaeon]|nr:hypothetical protein [Candidatus Bathyarchaeota archaeon]
MDWKIKCDEDLCEINAGILSQQVWFKGHAPVVTEFLIASTRLLGDPVPLWAVNVHRAIPDEEPVGITLEDCPAIMQEIARGGKTDGLKVDESLGKFTKQKGAWELVAELPRDAKMVIDKKNHVVVESPSAGMHHASVKCNGMDGAPLE